MRNLILNQRVETSSPFIDPAAWLACGEPRSIEGLSVFGGLDLSESGDLTALVLGHVDVDGVWNIKAHFWLPGDRIAEKAARDHAPYDDWAATGALELTPGAAIGYGLSPSA